MSTRWDDNVRLYAMHKREAYLANRKINASRIYMNDPKLGKPIEVLSSAEIIITNDLFLDDLIVIRTPLEEMEEQIHMAIDTPTVRLSINQDRSINTMMWPVQSGMVITIKDTYENADELPDWMQLKLAALMLLDADEPNKKEVEGIGRRISESIFWIYLDDGSNTGKESKDQST